MSTALTGSRPLILIDGASGLSSEDLGILTAAGLARPERVGSLQDAAALLADRPGSVVVLPVRGPDPALDAFGLTLRAHPESMAIAIAPDRDTESVLTAMRAGIAEFLVTPLHPAEVQSALKRLLARATSTSVASSRPQGQIIAVHAAKGGLGTSTVAASLAAVLTERPSRATSESAEDRRVVLVDFSSAGAGLRVMLNVEPANDLSRLQHRTDAVDQPFVRSLLHEHQGVALLAAGLSDAPEGLDSVRASHLLGLLRQQFDLVVVDTDHVLTEQTLAALDAADHILVVGQPEILALRSVQQALALCGRLGYRDHTVHVVMNRTTERDRLGPTDIRRVLGRSIVAQVPNAYHECHAAIAAGAFIPRHAPRSPLAAAYRQLATAVVEGPVTSRSRRHASPLLPGFSRFFGRGAPA